MQYFQWSKTWQEQAWILEIGVVAFLLVFANFILNRALFRSRQKGHLKENDWRVHLDSAALLPARVVLWVLFLSFSIRAAAAALNLGDSFSWIAMLRNVSVVVCVGWFLIRWKKVFHNAIAHRRVKGKLAFDPVSMEIISKIFTICVLFLSLLLILGFFGLNIVPLLTFGGIGTAAIGFASKDVIANFFGGLMLYITRPFTPNDLIEIPGKEITGTIEEIGWYFTSVRDVHKRPVYIPNSVFSTELLLNLSRMTHRKLEETLRIRFEDADKAQTIVDQIRTFLKASAELDHHESIEVYLDSIGPDSLLIEVKAYSLTTRHEAFTKIKQEILLEIYRIIHDAGAEIALPRTSVEVSRF